MTSKSFQPKDAVNPARANELDDAPNGTNPEPFCNQRNQIEVMTRRHRNAAKGAAMRRMFR